MFSRHILPTNIAEKVEPGEYERLQFLHDSAKSFAEDVDGYGFLYNATVIVTLIGIVYGYPSSPLQDLVGYHPTAAAAISFIGFGILLAGATRYLLHRCIALEQQARQCYTSYQTLLCRKYRDHE